MQTVRNCLPSSSQIPSLIPCQKYHQCQSFNITSVGVALRHELLALTLKPDPDPNSNPNPAMLDCYIQAKFAYNKRLQTKHKILHIITNEPKYFFDKLKYNYKHFSII